MKGEGSLATLMTMIHPLHATFVGSSFLLNNGIIFSLLCGALGIVVAILLIAYVLRSDKGTEKMLEIAAAVQEGAKAYLNRQITTISVIAVVIFVILLKVKGLPVSQHVSLARELGPRKQLESTHLQARGPDRTALALAD